MFLDRCGQFGRSAVTTGGDWNQQRTIQIKIGLLVLDYGSLEDR